MISGGQYLFWTGFVYFWTGMFDIFVYRFTEPEYIEMVWILILMIPVFLPVNKFVRGAPFIQQ